VTKARTALGRSSGKSTQRHPHIASFHERRLDISCLSNPVCNCLHFCLETIQAFTLLVVPIWETGRKDIGITLFSSLMALAIQLL
jgi:hypothetical protein